MVSEVYEQRGVVHVDGGCLPRRRRRVLVGDLSAAADRVCVRPACARRWSPGQVAEFEAGYARLLAALSGPGSARDPSLLSARRAAVRARSRLVALSGGPALAPVPDVDHAGVLRGHLCGPSGPVGVAALVGAPGGAGAAELREGIGAAGELADVTAAYPRRWGEEVAFRRDGGSWLSGRTGSPFPYPALRPSRGGLPNVQALLWLAGLSPFRRTVRMPLLDGLLLLDAACGAHPGWGGASSRERVEAEVRVSPLGPAGRAARDLGVPMSVGDYPRPAGPLSRRHDRFSPAPGPADLWWAALAACR